MLEENKNLKSHIKDPERKSLTSYGAGTSNMSDIPSFNKINKLISALYMVTDIMDKEEPLRNKLRNLGTNIISDIHLFYKGQSFYNQISNKISEILSFLEISSSVNIISEMNCSILTKEFIELRKSIIEITPKNEQVWLQEFLTSSSDLSPHPDPLLSKERGNSNGHTSIGVQRGGTLLKALSRVEVSDRIPSLNKRTLSPDVKSGSRPEGVGNKRHEEIVLIIKDKMKNSLNFSGVTITDIKNEVKSLPADKAGVLASCGEKTLQRELVSMVSGGVLKKTGEKRWSRYSLN